jgi:MYXO-CTERM domain-containing protein
MTRPTRRPRGSWSALLFCLPLACTLTSEPAKERLLGPADHGTLVSLEADALITLELEARTSTGYTWELAGLDESILKLASRDHLAAPAMGGMDIERLRFTGVSAGRTRIELRYHRPWEASASEDPLYSVDVSVAGRYSGSWTPPEPKDSSPSSVAQALGAGPPALNLCDPGDGGYGRCTPIKNQGQCGGCWAFATAGVFENLLYFSDPSTVPSLSEQYLISCNSQGYNCAQGGSVAFSYYLNTYVDPPETAAGAVYTPDFPFTATDTSCGSQAHPHHEKLTSFASIPGWPADVDSLKDAIMTAGPVWTAVCADSAFSNYKFTGGSANVFHGTCTQLNHAVILVGWNDNNGDGYWLMRNSWGNKWGDRGYMRIAYGANGIGSSSYKAVYGSQPPINTSPTADAGVDQTVRSGVTVTLDGTGSKDSDGTIASYAWSQGSGPSVALNGGTAAKATFTAPQVAQATALSFSLAVKDNGGATGTDAVTITVRPPNQPPVADAGTNQTVDEGASVTLDGTGSRDPDGTITRSAWSQTSGPSVALSGAATARATLTAPTQPATLGFALTVEDDSGASASQAVTVTVVAPNQPPVADAGVTQTVAQRAAVTLDGSGSRDPDGTIAAYAWTQTSGPTVALSGAATAAATFTAPSQPSQPAALGFTLTVTDDRGATDSASVTVSVSPNQAPSAVAKGPTTVARGATVTLDGSSSADADGVLASTQWVQTGGTAVSLSGSQTASATFVAPAAAGELAFTLTVTDDQGASASGTVVMTIVETVSGGQGTGGSGTGDVPGSGGGSGSGSVVGAVGAVGCSAAGGPGWAVGLAVMALAMARRRRRGPRQGDAPR